MKAVAVLLMLTMTVVDTTGVVDRLLMRGLGQGLCLVVAIAWWLPNISKALTPGYLATFWYLALLVISGLLSIAPGYVLLQVGSVASVVLFWAAYVERSRGRVGDPYYFPALASMTFLAIPTLLSLVLAVTTPRVAYEFATGTNRLEGVYQEPATLAATAGFLFGLALFVRTAWTIRIGLAVSAMACMALAGSRTFMIAAIVALATTTWKCYPRKRRIALAGAGLALLLIAATYLFDWRTDASAAESYLRADSVETLTGRTTMWDRAISGLPGNFLIGYGFTLGALSLDAAQSLGQGIAASRIDAEISQTKLHSGYIQALMDTGIIGFLLYCSILGYGLYKLLSDSNPKQHAWLLYSLTFLLVANFAETLLHSVSVFRSAYGWMIVVFAIALRTNPDPVTYPRYFGGYFRANAN